MSPPLQKILNHLDGKQPNSLSEIIQELYDRAIATKRDQRPREETAIIRELGDRGTEGVQ